MKFTAILLIAVPAVSAAFAPGMSRPAFTSSLTMINGKPAASKEEDLELTRKVILDFLNAELGPEDDYEDEDESAPIVDETPPAVTSVAAAETTTPEE